jgi:elongation factor G
MKTDLPNCNPVVLQLPIGKEAQFAGMIDLFTEQAFVWDTGDEVGVSFSTQDVPADMKDLVAQYRTKLIDSIVETDEALFAKYCDSQPITVEELKAALRKATIARTLVPVLCGSALRNKGVQPLLDAVVDYLPSPLEISTITATKSDGTEVELKADPDGPLAVQAFKIHKNKFGTLTFVRVVSGTLSKGQRVWNSKRRVYESISQPVKLIGIHQDKVDKLAAGDIGAVIGCKLTLTGDTLCDESFELTLRGINIPDAVVSQAIEAKAHADQEKLMKGLGALAEMDPSFKWTLNPETGQTVIWGLGELHLEIIKDRLLKEYEVDTNVGAPEVAFRETVLSAAEAMGEQKKQSGGHGQFAVVKLRIEPAPAQPVEGLPEAEDGVIFVNKITGGAIPQEFIPDIEAGVREAAKCGALASYPVVGVMVTLLDGKFHEVDSSKIAFKLAGIDGFKKAFSAAKPALLEPMGKLDVVVPEQFTGAMYSEIQQRRGKVLSSDSKNGQTVAQATVPMSEMFGFTGSLRGKTEGKGAGQVTPSGYELAPESVVNEMLEKNEAKAKK